MFEIEKILDLLRSSTSWIQNRYSNLTYRKVKNKIERERQKEKKSKKKSKKKREKEKDGKKIRNKGYRKKNF